MSRAAASIPGGSSSMRPRQHWQAPDPPRHRARHQESGEGRLTRQLAALDAGTLVEPSKATVESSSGSERRGRNLSVSERGAL